VFPEIVKLNKRICYKATGFSLGVLLQSSYVCLATLAYVQMYMCQLLFHLRQNKHLLIYIFYVTCVAIIFHFMLLHVVNVNNCDKGVSFFILFHFE